MSGVVITPGVAAEIAGVSAGQGIAQDTGVVAGATALLDFRITEDGEPRVTQGDQTRAVTL